MAPRGRCVGICSSPGPLTLGQQKLVLRGVPRKQEFKGGWGQTTFTGDCPRSAGWFPHRTRPVGERGRPTPQGEAGPQPDLRTAARPGRSQPLQAPRPHPVLHALQPQAPPLSARRHSPGLGQAVSDVVSQRLPDKSGPAFPSPSGTGGQSRQGFGGPLSGNQGALAVKGFCPGTLGAESSGNTHSSCCRRSASESWGGGRLLIFPRRAGYSQGGEELANAGVAPAGELRLWAGCEPCRPRGGWMGLADGWGSRAEPEGG